MSTTKRPQTPAMHKILIFTLVFSSPSIYAFDVGAACGGECSTGGGGWLGTIIGLWFVGYFFYLGGSLLWNSLLGKVTVRKGDNEGGYTNTEIANRILNYPYELTPDSWITKEEKVLIEEEKELIENGTNIH